MTKTKLSNADKAFEKFCKAIEKNNLVTQGACGDRETWSVAVATKMENINSVYVIVDYTEWEDEDPQIELYYTDFRDAENVIESVEIGDYKTVTGAVKKIVKELTKWQS